MSPQTLQNCMATALDAFVAERGQAAVARLVGVCSTTVGRWGSDPAAWPVSALLAIAACDEGMRRALVKSLTGYAGDCPAATLVRVADLLADELLDGATTIADSAARLPIIDAAMAKLRAIRAEPLDTPA